MFYFSIREGWRNFGSLGIIGLLSLVSLTITLMLFGVALRGYVLVEEWKTGLLGRFEIEAFLSVESDSSTAVAVAGKINELPAVGNVEYISAEMAAKRFSEQFDVDLFDLLEFNPLPPSLVVSLKDDADPTESWEATAVAIAELDSVFDVVYEGELLASVNRFYRNAGRAIGAAVALALIVSIFLTIMATQNVIRSREDFIQVVTLSGGTAGMARGPFVALGAYYGVLSGITASAVVLAFGWFIRIGWGLGSATDIWWIPILITSGALIGMIGSGWAASRSIRKV
ncbi:MAG: hypothetical protein HQ568_09125 [Calditrichaeota bacterium]|nr:hypothetical protein [Calditrichota bacterium]